MKPFINFSSHLQLKYFIPHYNQSQTVTDGYTEKPKNPVKCNCTMTMINLTEIRATVAETNELLKQLTEIAMKLFYITK